MWFFTKKTTVEDSGILSGIVDWHSHLLPGVDDGVQTREETDAILKRMQSTGVGHVVLTPHIMEDIPNETTVLNEKFVVVQKDWHETVALSIGAENMLDNLFLKRLEAKDLLPIENDMLLVETSYFNPPIDFNAMLSSIFANGLFPALAHPERYRYMNDTDYDMLKSIGVRFQLNIPSLVGAYGREAYEKSHRLLKKGYYNMVGLDIHRLAQYEHFLAAELPDKVSRAVKDLITESNSYLKSR